MPLNSLERIAAQSGCDILTIGASQPGMKAIALVVREDGTTITAASIIDVSNNNNIIQLNKLYLSETLIAGDLITFEGPLSEITIGAGSVMIYFG